VAVKVQHEWIKEQVPGDLRLIEFAVNAGMLVFPDFKYGVRVDEDNAMVVVASRVLGQVALGAGLH